MATVYTYPTTDEQEEALTLAAQPLNQTNAQVFSSIVTQALLNLDAGELQSLVQIIEQNNGLKSLEQIAAQPPNPNAQGKV